MSYYKPGVWNAICDVCGFEFKSDKMKKRWDGLMVCSDDFELDHPQKYLRVREESQSVPWVRTEPEDTFVFVCYLYAISAYAGLAEAGCAQAGVTTLPYTTLLEMKEGTR
jgi:hypothetical protein